MKGKEKTVSHMGGARSDEFEWWDAFEKGGSLILGARRDGQKKTNLHVKSKLFINDNSWQIPSLWQFEDSSEYNKDYDPIVR